MTSTQLSFEHLIEQLNKHKETYHTTIAPIEGELLEAIHGELSTLLSTWGVQLYRGIGSDPDSDTYTIVFPGVAKPHYQEYELWFSNIIESLVPYSLWEVLMHLTHWDIRLINLLPHIGDSFPPPSDLYWLEESTTLEPIPWDLYWDSDDYRVIPYEGASFTSGTAYYGPINQYLVDMVLAKVLPVTTLPRYMAREKQVISYEGIELIIDHYQ